MWRVALAAFVLFSVVCVVTVGVLWTMRRRERPQEPELPPSPASEAEDEDAASDSESDSESAERAHPAAGQTSLSPEENARSEGLPASDQLLCSPPSVQSPVLNYGSTDIRAVPITPPPNASIATTQSPRGNANTIVAPDDRVTSERQQLLQSN